MTVNAIIRRANYNDIRNKVIDVLGGGAGNFGYGQPIRSSLVTESNKVTVNEWTNLYYDIVNCYVHQTGSAPPAITTAVEGATVRSNPTNSPYTQYDTFANTIVSNRFAITQSATTANGTISQVWPGPYGTVWSGTLQATVSISFANATAARYFFNSGGQIRFTSSRSGGASSRAQNISWTSILSGAGTRSFGGALPNAGIDPNDGTNFYRLSSAYQEWTRAAGSSPYTSNVYRILAKCNVGDNSAGTATTVDFLIQWIDGYVDPGDYYLDSPNDNDEVDGTIALSVSTLYATGVLVPAGSGNFAVSTPTVSLGAITPV